MSADFKSGKPLFVMCCLHMGTARKGGGGGVKACQDGLGTFFPSARGCKGLPGWFGAPFFHVCPFNRGGGGGSNAFSTMPI